MEIRYTLALIRTAQLLLVALIGAGPHYTAGVEPFLS